MASAESNSVVPDISRCCPRQLSQQWIQDGRNWCNFRTDQAVSLTRYFSIISKEERTPKQREWQISAKAFWWECLACSKNTKESIVAIAGLARVKGTHEVKNGGPASNRAYILATVRDDKSRGKPITGLAIIQAQHSGSRFIAMEKLRNGIILYAFWR